MLSLAPTLDESGLFAIVDDAGRAHVFSAHDQRRVAEFPLMTPEARIALLGGPRPLLFASWYHEHGTAGYDLAGKRIWHRPDFKKATAVVVGAGPERPTIAINPDYASSWILNVWSGKAVAQHRGAREFFGAPQLHRFLVVKTLAIELHGSETWQAAGAGAIWRHPLTRHGVLMVAALRDGGAAFSSGGVLSRLDDRGQGVWTFRANPGSHFLDLAWVPSLRAWAGIESGGRTWLTLVDDQSGALRSRTLDERSAISGARFFAEGELLITPRGMVLKVPELTPIWSTGVVGAGLA